MENINLKSKDLIKTNIKKIEALFPNVVKEINKNGKIIKKIDFNVLKQELAKEIIEDESKERYQMTWPGKREAESLANTPTTKTLRPVKTDSVDWENTENIYIEGDNLEVLKLLQESYLGKIKCIYIDPPYNTGEDFIYKDRFAQEKGEYLEDSGQVDEEGNRLFQNTESNGRYHSDWLSMMYPRLKLARNLLTDNGVIFISIDDNEIHNLRKLCDEIFGEGNFIASYIHKNNSSKNQAKLVSISTQYFLCYSKNKTILIKSVWRLKKKGAKDISKMFNYLKTKGLSLEEIEDNIKEMYKRPKYSHLSRWNKVDDNGVFQDADLSRKNGYKNFTIINPYTQKECIIPSRGWGKSKDELIELQKEDLIWYGDENTPPRLKDYISQEDEVVPDNFWYHDNSVDTRWFIEVFEKLIFDNPKPLEMIKNIIEMICMEENGIILDFFSGSATTAHAVLKITSEDFKKRKFIMVQLDENLDNSYKMASSEKKKIIKNAIDYLDIINKPHLLSEIGKERIRRAGKQIKEETNAEIDYGFRVYRLDSSSIKEINKTPEEYTQTSLDFDLTTIKKDRTDEDLLIHVILSLGLELSLNIKEEIIEDKKVFNVAGNSLIAFFSNNITDSLIEAIAKREPSKVVFRDSSFRNDDDKLNVEEIFKMFSPDTDIMVL